MILLSEKEEAYLKKIIHCIDTDNEFTMSSSSGSYKFFLEYEKKYAESLDSKGLIDYKSYIGAAKIILKPDGESYFEMKEKYLELQQGKNYTINVNAQHNSPVNINQGSGTATQNVEKKSNIKTTKNSLSMKKIFEIVVGIAAIIGAIAAVLAIL